MLNGTFKGFGGKIGGGKGKQRRCTARLSPSPFDWLSFSVHKKGCHQ